MVQISEYDKTHLNEIVYGGQGDWFGAQLLRLIGKADLDTREQIRAGFPDYVQAWEDWFYKPSLEVVKDDD